MIRERFNERQSGCTIEGDIVDLEAVPVPAASLTSATLTFYDLCTHVPGSLTGIINGRSVQNVLNANQVTIDSSGHFIWSLQPADNSIVTLRRQVERHRALFVFGWAQGSFPFELEVEVVNSRGLI